MPSRYTHAGHPGFRLSGVRFRTAEWRKRTKPSRLLDPAAAVVAHAWSSWYPRTKREDTQNEPDFNTYRPEPANGFSAVFVFGSLPRDSWQGNSLQRCLFPRDLARWNA